MRATTAVAALLGCAGVAPSTAFTVGAGFARTAGRSGQSGRSRRAAMSAPPGVRMMAIDPSTVHSVGDYVNAVGSAGLDHSWLAHVMHGERKRAGRERRTPPPQARSSLSCAGRSSEKRAQGLSFVV